MQSLAGYGSDSDDGDEAPVTSTSIAIKAQAQHASTSSSQRPASPAPPAALTRIKGAATSGGNHSRAQSPLSGVKMSPLASPRLSTTLAQTSLTKLGKRTSSSTSPPPYARRTSNSGVVDQDDPDGVASNQAGPSSVRLDSLSEFGIPPVPTGPCNPAVEFYELSQTRGLHFNDSLLRSKAFRNPRIYNKLVEFVQVDETGSNWSKKVWNSSDIGSHKNAASLGNKRADRICSSSSFFYFLSFELATQAEAQKIRSEARQAGQKAGSRSSIAFASSSSSSTNNATTLSSSRRNDKGLYRDKERTASHKDSDRDRDRDKDRDRERDRARERDDRHRDDSSRKKSRWDSGTGMKSPRRR
ncbi:hypothetical protein OIO90_003027 [Microbotryomycetes sp. JL221]|nr:hypothetical protein OIO90_003027 [Microbotryomycetes sp. JL221]